MSKALRYIECFRPGTFQPMAGDPVTLTADDLKAIAAGYDAAGAPAPAVVGHPKTDDPAYGWARSFSFDEASQRLVAGIGDLEPAFEQAVKDKRYAKISLSLFRPDASNNPKPGSWYPKHVGFLGGAAPAVTGLAPVNLAGDDDGVLTVEFGEEGLRDVASMFRRLRDWFIEKYGLDEADKVISDWDIVWLQRQAERDDDDRPGMSFAAPAVPQKEASMTKPDDAALAAREKAIADREVAAAQREAELRHADHVAFAEGLAADGRLLPASKDKAVAVLDALASTDRVEASFADGDATVNASALSLVKEILQAQPKVVSFGEMKMGEGQPDQASFAAPAGMDVDPDGLAVVAKATAYQRAHPDVSFLDAVKAVR